MAKANGVLDLGELVPETVPVRINGRDLKGYVYGDRCPRSIKAAWRAAYLDYQRARGDAQEAPEASSELTTAQLMVVIPGLQHSEADLLGTDAIVEILERLRWWTSDETTEGAESENPPVASPTGSG